MKPRKYSLAKVLYLRTTLYTYLEPSFLFLQEAWSNCRTLDMKTPYDPLALSRLHQNCGFTWYSQAEKKPCYLQTPPTLNC